ncbi:MAG: CxxC-x17-CxxC domain-containing protein [archaeon]
MADFNRNKIKSNRSSSSKFRRAPSRLGSSGGRRFHERDGNESFGGRTGKSRADYQMHKVTCDKCKTECEVPFAPTGNKPVFCRDCFNKESPRGKDFSGRESSFKPSNRTGNRESFKSGKSELDEINRKLDKIMRALKIE